jgi:hypothetical protein
MPSLFGRTKQDESTVIETDLKEGGKGRPTPKRKEAEAASRERARLGMDEKTAKKVLRDRRAEDTKKMRDALKGGDERNLPARDRGPVKRFVRDYVDSRVCIAEFLLVGLIVIMVLSYSGNSSLRSLGFTLQTVIVVLTVIDTSWLIFRMKRAMRVEFPDESLRGVNSYTVMRALQMRFMRLPKPRVGLGGKPR